MFKPCPFCGSANLESGGDDKIVAVRCRDCEATGPNHYGSRAEWNTRSLHLPEPRTAPASCPNCADETDCSNVRQCRAVEEAYAAPADAERLALAGGDHLKRCTICGFVIDVSYKAEKPTADFTTRGRAKTKSAEEDEEETYQIGVRDGYESAIQDLDIATGGDGEFRGSTIPGRAVDVPTMKARIIERCAPAAPTTGLADGEAEKLAERPRPIDEYHEDMGDVLWWKFPITEAPYVGNPNDLGHVVEVTVATADGGNKMTRMIGGWPGDHTHFTPIPIPRSQDRKDVSKP